jgi:hypothetical protein
MSEVPKCKPTDADRTIAEGPKCEPTDAGRALTEGPKYKPTDADRTITEGPKYEPTDAGQYEPNEAERVALNKQAQRQKEQPPAPRLSVVDDYRGTRTELDHPDEVVAHSLLKGAVGTTDDDFCHGLLAHLSIFQGDGLSASVENDVNFRLSVIKSQKPKDELHSMLLALMGVAFQMPMRAARNF